ncbi:MAG TPA: hypothetical protein VM285_03465 [Polyangia bacterium]|nr:hypothetical protein [Polyangia bacterium]
MSAIFYLFLAGALCGLAALALHVAMIVLGFRTAAKWGLIGLFVPAGSLVFAFARSGRRGLAAVFLLAVLGCGVMAGIASHLTAQAAIGATETAAEGLKEFDRQTDELSKVENLDLDLGGEE